MKYLLLLLVVSYCLTFTQARADTQVLNTFINKKTGESLVVSCTVLSTSSCDEITFSYLERDSESPVFEKKLDLREFYVEDNLLRDLLDEASTKIMLDSRFDHFKFFKKACHISKSDSQNCARRMVLELAIVGGAVALGAATEGIGLVLLLSIFPIKNAGKTIASSTLAPAAFSLDILRNIFIYPVHSIKMKKRAKKFKKVIKPAFEEMMESIEGNTLSFEQSNGWNEGIKLTNKDFRYMMDYLLGQKLP